LTLKAIRLLQTCSVVAFPQGRQGQPGIAERIVQGFLQPDQVQLALDFPFVQDETVLTAAWEIAADRVWAYLQAGQDVIFATEGDASFYSTFSYLAQTVRDRYPHALIGSVPGVCSPLAAAAMVSEPLTQLNQRLLILPALYTVTDVDTALECADVLVLMKVASVYRDVWQILQRRQLLASSYVVVRATQTDQRIYLDLTDLPTLDLPYFSLLVVNKGRVFR
jgi:precorrin-2/cobalt-factor-2 C20-methyltransferase